MSEIQVYGSKLYHTKRYKGTTTRSDYRGTGR